MMLVLEQQFTSLVTDMDKIVTEEGIAAVSSLWRAVPGGRFVAPFPFAQAVTCFGQHYPERLAHRSPDSKHCLAALSFHHVELRATDKGYVGASRGNAVACHFAKVHEVV